MRRAGGRQATAGGRRCHTAQAGSGAMRLREEEPAGSVERRAGELGDRWRQKSGEGAAGGRGKCW
jgi:hypothetical protein